MSWNVKLKILRCLLPSFLISVICGAHALAWGNRGHEMIAEIGNGLAHPKVFENCHVSPSQIIEHSTDPDLKWRRDRRRHPDEEFAHFFHVNQQTEGWETREEPADKTQGFLIYRISKWSTKAKEFKTSQSWGELSEHLYGLVHYLGDLSMPLHLTSDHEGKEYGLPDLHKQWESKMVQRYEAEIREHVLSRVKHEGIPVTWNAQSPQALLAAIAKESFAKVPKLISSARSSIEVPRMSRQRRATNREVKPRFSKPKLYAASQDLVVSQIALSAKLWAHFFNLVCAP